MNYIRIFTRVLTLVLFLALAPAALASTTWYVDGAKGNDNNDCKSPQTACKTIGHAISLASSGDTIKVAPATYTENLSISISLKILGANAKTTIVDGGGNGTVVNISSSSANVTLSELTIQHGNGGHDFGGGVYSIGKVAIDDSTLSGNVARLGGGIYNGGTLTVNDNAISGNKASGFCIPFQKCFDGSGGGIYNWGTLTVNNSTISGNSAYEYSLGGGISNSGTLSLNNTTLSGNDANTGGGIWFTNYYGGSVTLQNSIVANSPKGGNCSGPMTSDGYNLSDDNTCNLNGPGDLPNTPAKLGKLGNHGGPTQTIPELEGSPAIDAGNPNGCTDGNGHLLKTDQRGYPRPGKYKTDKRCDMGAYEKQSD